MCRDGKQYLYHYNSLSLVTYLSQIHDEYLCKSFFGLFVGPGAMDHMSKRKVGRTIMKVLHGKSALSMHEKRNVIGALPLSYGVFSFTDHLKQQSNSDDAKSEPTGFVLNGIQLEKEKQAKFVERM